MTCSSFAFYLGFGHPTTGNEPEPEPESRNTLRLSHGLRVLGGGSGFGFRVWVLGLGFWVLGFGFRGQPPTPSPKQGNQGAWKPSKPESLALQPATLLV